MTPIEIASAVERIVFAVATGYGLLAESEEVSFASELHGDLGMDDVDIIETMARAEERFGVDLPDSRIGPASTVKDIVDLIAERVSEKEAYLARAPDYT